METIKSFFVEEFQLDIVRVPQQKDGHNCGCAVVCYYRAFLENADWDGILSYSNMRLEIQKDLEGTSPNPITSLEALHTLEEKRSNTHVSGPIIGDSAEDPIVVPSQTQGIS